MTEAFGAPKPFQDRVFLPTEQQSVFDRWLRGTDIVGGINQVARRIRTHRGPSRIIVMLPERFGASVATLQDAVIRTGQWFVDSEQYERITPDNLPESYFPTKSFNPEEVTRIKAMQDKASIGAASGYNQRFVGTVVVSETGVTVGAIDLQAHEITEIPIPTY